ncbi:MAG: metallophosphoesterase [Fibrobacter sp.]|nr:metallophosphoesterase [Fibrobacter sp.]
MPFFLILLFVGLVLIYVNVSLVVPGKKGKLVALGVLLAIFGGMAARGTFVGSLVVAFTSVWLCQALLFYIPWGIFRVVRRVVTRRAMRASAVMRVCRILLAVTVTMTLGLIAVGVPHNAEYWVIEKKVKLPAPSQPAGDSAPSQPANFTAVFFSDIHVDPLFDRGKLERMIADVDSIKPDYLLFGGDLADVSMETLDEWGYDTLFRKLTAGAKVAAIAVNGNHEGMQERPGSDPGEWMRKVGFIFLDDATVCVENACFTGRTDFQVARSRGMERRPLAELVPKESAAGDTGVAARTKPWILLDHQPKGIEPGYSGRLPDYALSGHTHNGQFFPGNIVINFVWRLAYGEGVLDGVRWLVSSGIDCWGPPVRVGTDAEMWVLRFEFEQ